MKRLMEWLMILVVLYVAMSLFLVWREPSMIYYPDRKLEATPTAVGLPYEDVTLTATDGTRLNAWWIPTLDPHALTVLFLHGNAGNISHRLGKLCILNRFNTNILIVDYRGYGHSEGTPNERGTYRDAQAAYDYVTKTLNREPYKIVVYGESLGSAIAVDLASKQNVGGVIIEEPFTSVGDIGQKMFPFLPVRLLVRNKYDTLRKISHINAPLLIFHSRDDELFPFTYAERLLRAARNPKRLIELRGGHNDAFAVSIDTYQDGLKTYLTALPR